MTTTINDAEIAKFTAMAEEWWNPKGKFKPLHKFNPVRLAYIREHLLAHFGGDASAMRPFVRGGEGGSGLGLAIVERVARQHGGCLDLRPNTPAGLHARLTLRDT